MNPLDENHQALLIRLYRLLGDDAAAQRQLDACVELFDRELGVPPGIAIEAATRESRYERYQTSDAAAVEALVEAGSAALSAGAFDAGVAWLRPRSASPTTPRPRPGGSRPGSLWARPTSTPWVVWTRKGWPGSTKRTRSPATTV